MGVFRGKTVRNVIAALLAALALFCCSYLIADAQAPAPDADYGIGTVASNLELDGLRYYLFVTIAGIGSLIAWLGGMIFDLSIAIFTVGMVDTVKYLGLDVAISEMWAVIRDIFNLLFIFGLIYAGFKIILDANDAASKRTVGTIIMAALLINFSLYVAQIVVDFTNIAAYQIHQMIAPDDAAGKTVLGIKVANTSSQFYSLTGLEEQRNDIGQEIGAVSGSESSSNTFLGALVLGFIFLIFYAILGFVLAACAILLITRFFALIFLMIFSPLMFLGWVLPSMKGRSSDWWRYFSNQALVGPAMIFMIYLSLRALQGIGDSATQGGLAATIVYLLLVTAFLFASLRVAKSLGAYGASQAISIGQSWGRSVRGYAGSAAGGATLGLAGRIGRSQIGSRAQRYADSDEAKDAAAKSRWGRLKWNMATKLGDSSFDGRNVGGVGKKMGLGTGAKGGYKTSTDAVVKREKEFAKKLGEVSDDDPRVIGLKVDVDSFDQAIKNKKAELQDLRKNKADQATIDAARAEVEDLEEKQGDAKERLQQEKQRRQLGVVAPVGESAYWDGMVRDKKKEIKDQMDLYISSTDPTNKEAHKKAVMEKKKELADFEKQRDKAMGGYANTVENAGIIKNFFSGSNAEQNREAAKKLREEYKKKVKDKDKSKEKEKSEPKDSKKEENKEE